MNEFEFVDNHIELRTMPKTFKKLTATRFAAAMGLNRWNTPFQTWCNITRTWEEPFEDSIYTIAGNVIEGKVINYLNDVYFMDLKSPEDIYGQDFFRKTWGDFFHNEPIFGGMWDAKGDTFVVEIKTTKCAEDWAQDVPIYYKLQACLYAYLLGFDDVIVTVSFLDEKDYPIVQADGTYDTTPCEAFEPCVDNTKIYEFKLSEAFPFFEDNYIVPALHWWHEHVETGVSPDFDEKADAAALKDLRKTVYEPDDKEMVKLIAEADKLKESIDKAEARIAEKVERLKEIDALVKKTVSKQIPEGGKTAEVQGKKYVWTITKKAGRATIDSKALKAEEPTVYQKYLKQGAETFSLTKKAIEAEPTK